MINFYKFLKILNENTSGFFADQLKSALNVLEQNKDQNEKWLDFNNIADELIMSIEQEIKKGYKLSQKESELYSQVKKQLEYIHTIWNDERYDDQDY